ncbi:hypothetical protein ACWGI0_16605 [Streptomyces sp. NPDC054802]
MFRYAFLAAPSAVADAPKAAAFPATEVVAVAVAVAKAAVSAAGAAAAPFDGARS